MNLEIILNTIYSIFLMKVLETIQINAPDSKIWNTLKSFQVPENYIPAVQSSTFSGNGQGATRGCQGIP